MPIYRAKVDLLLAHESRRVLAGQEFETTFPEVGGKPMRLEPNIELVEDSKPAKPVKAKGHHEETLT